MKIILVTKHGSIVGGAEKIVAQSLLHLFKRGHQLLVLSESDPSLSAEPLVSLSIISDQLRYYSIEHLSELDFQNILNDFQGQVTIVHGEISENFESFILSHFPCPMHYVHNHEGNCISGTRTMMFPYPKTCTIQFGPQCLINYIPRRCGGKSPSTMYTLYKVQRTAQKNLKQYHMRLVASRFMFHLQQQQLHQPIRYIPLFPTDIQPLLNPISPKSIQHQLLYIGRLTYEKGIHILLKAMTLLQECSLGKKLTLHIAGDGPLRDLCLQEATKNPFIQFHGWCSKEQRELLMKECDALVIPSIWSEPFGLVGIEAGCLSLPSIAFHKGGISDWLFHQETGILIDSQTVDPMAFAYGIQQFYDRHTMTNTMGIAAHRVAQSYSVEHHITLLENAISEAMLLSS
jgi:glycosyltransferase involved in cell wall biosynthesis